MDAELVAIIGALFGSALSVVASVWTRMMARRLRQQFAGSDQKETDAKLHVTISDSSGRVIDIEPTHLGLGEILSRLEMQGKRDDSSTGREEKKESL
jgi:hypothetical protein